MRYLFPTVLILFVVFQPENVDADTCIITKYNASDIKTAQVSCSTITINDIEVTAGETLDLSNLKSGAKVIFAGRITWGYKEWEGPLIEVDGTGVTITGESGHVLDGRGKLWWDGQGANGKKKPKFFKAKLKNSQITGLNIKDSPVHIFSINGCEELAVDSVTIDNSAGDLNGGKNTDAFDVGDSNSITINNCTVQNQDDCLAVNSGTEIIFSNNVCIGGHGISIGSVGGRSNNVVKGVNVSNCEVINSENGIRIKTVYRATGSVSNITYSDITLSNIKKYGIAIQGDYEDGKPTGTPTGGVPVKGVTVKNVNGTVASGGTNYYFLVTNAADWKFSNVTVSGGTKNNSCIGIPSGAGISCR